MAKITDTTSDFERTGTTTYSSALVFEGVVTNYSSDSPITGTIAEKDIIRIEEREEG